MAEFSLLEPDGQRWTENHLLDEWSESIEGSLSYLWQHHENQIIQCHPEQAFLLLLRQYLLGVYQDLEQRLRKLVYTLAKFGESERVVAVLSLLGLIIIEQKGIDPDVEAIYKQIEKEDIEYGSYAYVLRLFFFAQICVLKGNLDFANKAYSEFIDGKIHAYTLSSGILGRVYEKLGCYAHRTEDNALKIRWRLAAEQWYLQFPKSIVANRVQWLLNERIDTYKKHPIFIWNTIKISLSLKPFNELTNDWELLKKFGTIHDLEPVKEIVVDQEIRIVSGLINAYLERSQDAYERVSYQANLYGDPFWQEQVKLLCYNSTNDLPAIEPQNQPILIQQVSAHQVSVHSQIVFNNQFRFTFFESFQAISANGNPLFPQRYKRKKVKQLLALLVLQPRYQIVKDILVEKLLGDNDERNKSSNYLHVLIHRLRELFYMQTKVQNDWIWIQNNMVFLNEDRISGVDLQEYLKLASVGHQLWLDDQEAAIELYEKANRMFHVVIAPEFEYEDWFSSLCTDLVSHQQKILKRLSLHANSKGSLEQVIYYCEELLKIDVWDLSTVSMLCEKLERSGHIQRLLDVCTQYEQMFHKDNEECPPWLVFYKLKYKPNKSFLALGVQASDSPKSIQMD